MSRHDHFHQDAPEYTVSARCISDDLLKDVGGGIKASGCICPFCGAAFGEERDLSCHLVDIHGDEQLS